MEDLIKDLGSLSMAGEPIIGDTGSPAGASTPRMSAEASMPRSEAGMPKEQSAEAGMPREYPRLRRPVDGKAIKIYPFSIEKLNEDNARYWFHSIEKQMRV